MNILRNILAVIAGILVGGLVNMGIIMGGSYITLQSIFTNRNILLRLFRLTQWEHWSVRLSLL